MRICVVTQQLGRVYSGPGIHARNLIENLVKDGHEVVVVSQKHQKPDKPLGYQFFGVERPFLINYQARWIFLSFQFNKVIRYLERNFPFDLIHFTDARDSYFCRSRAKKIVNINDTYSAQLFPLAHYIKNYHDWLARWVYYRFVHMVEKEYLKNADAVIANSDFTANTVRDAYPSISSKLFRVYKSINAAEYRDILQARKEAGKPSSHQILLVGSNLQRKGIRYLIGAAPEIIQHLKYVQFVVAGGDPSIPKLIRECRAIRLQDHFLFLGNQTREQLNHLYANSTTFTLPSITEALGIVLLEAMACGIPVIGSQVGGIPEIIKDGVNGLLVPACDSSSLAKAVIQLVQNPNLQDRFIQAGLETVEKFSVENMMEETYHVYQLVLEKQ